MSTDAQATRITLAPEPESPPIERPRFSLTLKIFLAIAGVLFATLGAAVAISTYRAHSIADTSIRKALGRAKDAWDNFEADRYQKLHQSLRVVAENPGFKGLVAEGDPATIYNSLREDQAAATHADFLIVTDARGASIARSDKKDWRFDLTRSPIIARALERNETQGVWYSDGRLYDAVASPVVSGEGADARVNGVLLAGYLMDDKVAESFRDVSNNGAVVFANSARPGQPAALSPVGSTLGGATKAFVREFTRDGELVSAVFQHGMTAGPIRIQTEDDTFLGMAWPLRSAAGEIIGAVVTVRSLATELSAFRRIENTLLLVGGVALLLSFLLSYVVARRMTGPIEQMVAATQAVRDGEYTVPLPVEKTDEIGILARSFRRMIGELKEKEELEKQVAALTMERPFGAPASGQETVAVALPAGATPFSSTNAPQVGSAFAGRYDIESELGVGGMGVVYKAHDRQLDEEVAIKVLRSEALAQDPTLGDRFKQEIRLARKISHKNILRTHDIGETNGLTYLSMEYVRGITLKHFLRETHGMPKAAALRIARQVCAGLSAAHAAGVIHRDIKPQNIIIEPNGGLKIMDFGIARLSQEKGMTATGMVVGTPDYMSPEQAKGTALDQRSDIYSTGVVLYELFCGALPFEGETPLGVVLKHIQERPPAPEKKNPNIDPRLSVIILKSMEKDPAQRYQTIADLYKDLSEVMA
jgi:serine/threonine-protein kinase